MPSFIVYVGPSFPKEKVEELLPGADVRAPIRRGDLDDVPEGAAVAIIDGIFEAELAITPREIREALARGVRIFGASSMGAMRAAEVPSMLGVGRIYEMFRNGALERDDEVAVLLDPSDHRALTVPLVNMRYAVECLVSSGSLEPSLGETILHVASTIDFRDRTYRHILQRSGLPPGPELDVLVRSLNSFDLKREDAHTLLERLPQLLERSPVPRVASDGGEHYSDHFDAVEVSPQEAPDAPLLIWEYGERIAFDKLVEFLAITGRLAGVACGLSTSDAEESDSGPSVQELFDDVMASWGWRSPEEVHVTLVDLGIGFEELQEGLRLERQRRGRVIDRCRSSTDAWLRSLRVALLLDDLTLKREAMRLGALQYLAARAEDAAPTRDEIVDAKRAVLCERPELTWEGLLAETGCAESNVTQILDLIARARRRGVPLLERMDHPAGLTCDIPLGDFEEAPLPPGAASRSMADSVAIREARRLAEVIGVTRIAQIGQLESFGLHVAAAYRPSGWSSTLGSGKSETPDGAVVGAVMEELEKYCQDHFVPEIVASGPLRDLEASGKHAVDPDLLALPYDSSFKPEVPMTWTPVRDLLSGARVLVPSAVVTTARERNDVLFSPRRARKVFTSNGLAASFSMTEAVLHALCEKIERHAAKLAEQEISNPGSLPGRRWPAFTFVDLESVPEGTRRIVGTIRDAGFTARVLDITSEVKVPSFTARIMRVSSVHGLEDLYASGGCTHPNAEVALNRALLEAVQTRLASVSGAREDLGMKARSLGRHERPRPVSRGDAYWVRPSVPKKPLSAVGGVRCSSAREYLDFVLRRVAAAGFDRVLYTDMSRDEVAPARVARVLVPGMEDVNPFHTGMRARTRIVEDLMGRHEW